MLSLGLNLGLEQWEQGGQSTAFVTIFSFSWKTHSSDQIQQSHSGNNHMWPITRFIGRNQKKWRGKTHGLKLMEASWHGAGFLRGGLTNSCLTKGSFLPELFRSPVFHGIIICETGRALVSRPREAVFLFFQEDALRQWSHLTKLSRDLLLC